MPVVRGTMLPPSKTKWAWLQCALLMQAGGCESSQRTQDVWPIRVTGGENGFILTTKHAVPPLVYNSGTVCTILYHPFIGITVRTWMYHTISMFVTIHCLAFDLTWSPHLTLPFEPLLTKWDEITWLKSQLSPRTSTADHSQLGQALSSNMVGRRFLYFMEWDPPSIN